MFNYYSNADCYICYKLTDLIHISRANANNHVNQGDREYILKLLEPQVYGDTREIDGIKMFSGLEFIGLNVSRSKALEIVERMKDKSHIKHCVLERHLIALRDSIEHELSTKWFLGIEDNDVKHLIDAGSIKNEFKKTKFAHIKDDFMEAAACLIFSRWTSAVFHLTRVLERDVKLLCRRLRNVSTPVPTQQKEFPSWNDYLQPIEGEIKRLEILQKIKRVKNREKN